MLSSLLSNDCVHMKSFHAKTAQLITLLLLLQQRATSEFDLTMTIRNMSQEEVLAPLPMTQLQTDYITKTMVRKSYAASSSSNSNIGHHNLPITTGAADTTTLMIVTMVTAIKMKVHTIVKSTKVVSCNTSSSDNNDDDDDSVSSMTTLSSSLALLPRPSFDILNKLETHPKTIQLVASAGGLITHCE